MMFIAHTLITLRDKLAETDKERGATAVEYGLMVALIAIVIITAVSTVGDNLITVFNDIAGELQGIATGG